MSAWFMNIRQEFIYNTLRTFGQVRRTDLVREFGISLSLATMDLADFMAKQPPFVRYDVSAKMYVLEEPPSDK